MYTYAYINITTKPNQNIKPNIVKTPPKNVHVNHSALKRIGILALFSIARNLMCTFHI